MSTVDLPFGLKRHVSILMLFFQNEVVNWQRALIWLGVNMVSSVFMLMFWWAALETGERSVGGFALPALMSYFVLMITFGPILLTYVDYDVGEEDIYKGQLSVYLLKPYSYVLSKFFMEFAYRVVSGLLAFGVLGLFLLVGIKIQVVLTLPVLLVFVLSAVLGYCLSFFFKLMVGMSAFWLTTTRGLTELLEILRILLCGFVLPLSELPGILGTIALASPFAGMVYYPVRIVQGEIALEHVWKILLFQLGWIMFFFILGRIILPRGIKTYTGVGQ